MTSLPDRIGKAIGYIVAISVTAVFMAVVYKVIMWVVNF